MACVDLRPRKRAPTNGLARVIAGRSPGSPGGGLFGGPAVRSVAGRTPRPSGGCRQVVHGDLLRWPLDRLARRQPRRLAEVPDVDRAAIQAAVRRSGFVIMSFTASAPQPPMDSRIDALAPREREVLMLMARSLSNADVGRGLVLEPSTVNKHVANVLSKLVIRSGSAGRGVRLRARTRATRQLSPDASPTAARWQSEPCRRYGVACRLL